MTKGKYIYKMRRSMRTRENHHENKEKYKI